MNTIAFPQLGIELNIARYFSVFGFKIYWYGVIIALGFVLAFVYCMRRAARFGIKQNDIIDTAIIALPSAIVGCRILYVLCNLDQYKGHFWSVFKVWEGGIAIYGGLVTAIICVVLMCRKKQINFFNLADLAVCGLLIGQIIGRWGNFVNGEAYGIDVEHFFLGMSINGGVDVHPIFLYESVWNLIGLVILHFASQKRRFYGQIFLGYVAWYGVGRGFIEAIREENVLMMSLFGTELRVSQVIAFVSALVAIGILVYKLLFTDRADPILLASKEEAQAFRDAEREAEKQAQEARKQKKESAEASGEEETEESNAGWQETLDDDEPENNTETDTAEGEVTEADDGEKDRAIEEETEQTQK